MNAHVVIGMPIGFDDFNEMRYRVRCPLCHGTHVHALRADEPVEGMRAADCTFPGPSYIVRRPSLDQLFAMRAELASTTVPVKTRRKVKSWIATIDEEITRLMVADDGTHIGRVDSQPPRKGRVEWRARS
jgi:hypothetical protein